jgi:hypothetical protein
MMPDVPLPTGFQGIDEFPRLHENLINMLNAGGNKIYQRPGILSANVGFGACRGSHKFKNELYQVSGQQFIKISEDGTIRDLSDEFGLIVSGSNDCVFAEGFSHLVFIEKGGFGYAWDGVTFAQITSPNYVLSLDVTYMNGRYLFIPFDGQPAFFSNPFDPYTITALSFFDAETQPDLNAGILNFKQRLYILGEETTEVFRDTAAEVTPTNPVPYQRIDGGSIWTGLVSGHTLYGPSFAFLGKDKDNNFGFFLMGSGQADRISNDSVDELLNTFYTVEQLRQCTAHRLQWKGQDIAIFRLPFHTICFNGSGWFFMRSIATFDEKELLSEDFKTWRANHITHCYGEYYVGDEETSNIGILDEIASDYGDDITFGFDTYMRGGRESYFTAKSININGLTGQVEIGEPERTIGLSVSDDGLTYGPFFFEGLGLTGHYRKEIFWEMPGGLGDYENFMGIRVRTTAPVQIAAESLEVVV